ncbi:MAG: 30S ribosomal protein S20 [Patescibacteria group bacterium]|jgi:small subunit ribosomal protein S20
MANKQAALKARRQTIKRTAQNSAVKLSIKQHVKAVRKAIEAKDFAKAEEALKAAIKIIDKAGQNKIIKKNAVARKKSRLIRSVSAAKKK